MVIGKRNYFGGLKMFTVNFIGISTTEIGVTVNDVIAIDGYG